MIRKLFRDSTLYALLPTEEISLGVMGLFGSCKVKPNRAIRLWTSKEGVCGEKALGKKDTMGTTFIDFPLLLN